MHIRLEATAEELATKGTALIEALSRELVDAAPDLAESLEKALPPKEPELKYPMLRALQRETDAMYRDTVRAITRGIRKILDRKSGPVAKSLDTPKTPIEQLDEILREGNFHVTFDPDRKTHEGDLTKARGHKYTRRWKNAKGEWEYEYPEDKQLSLPLHPQAEAPTEHKASPLLATMVDGEKVDEAWATMSLALQTLHDGFVAWHDGFSEAGWSRKSQVAALQKHYDEFVAKIPKPRAVKVGGLLVETLDTAIEQHAAAMGHMAFEARRKALTDKYKDRFINTTKQLKEQAWLWQGLLPESQHGDRFFRAGQGMKLYPAQDKQDAEKARAERAKWTEKWQHTIGLHMADVAKLPESHQRLLDAAGVRVRFLTHTSVEESGGAFLAGEATYDDRTKDHLIQMYGWSAMGSEDSEDGVTLTHEVGHLVDRLIRMTASAGTDGYKHDAELRELLKDVVGPDKMEEIHQRDIADAKYMTDREVSWVQDTSEWVAEAYRYAYRDGGEMRTTLKSGDFDHAKLKTLVDGLVDKTLASGKVFHPDNYKPDAIELVSKHAPAQASPEPKVKKAFGDDDEKDPEDKPEPGDINIETGEVTPTEEEKQEAKQDAAEEKGDEGDEKSLAKAQAVPDMADRWKKLYARRPDIAKAHGKETVAEHTGEAYDPTKAIADADARAYARVRQALAKYGYTAKDFDAEDGRLYGQSVNELLALARELRRA